jgi:hypothetical protein
MADFKDRLPEKVTIEDIETMTVQMAEARKGWAQLPAGTMIPVSKELLIDLTDRMLEFSYFVLGWQE